MRLRHIEVFQAVMETGTMSSAGRLINLTQSAVSRVIAHAERQLGYPLFKRVGGKLVPTTEGLVLFQESAGLFERLESLRRTARNLKSGMSGQLRIAAIPAICHQFLPDVLAAYHRAVPEVVCEVRTLHKRQITSALLSREVDLAFDFYAINHPGIESIQLERGQLFVIAPPGFAARSRNPLARLAELPLVSLVGDDPLNNVQSQISAQLGFEPLPGMSVQTSQLAEEMVARGIGWAVVDFLTARNMKAERVRVIPLPAENECPLNAFVVKSNGPTVQARDFLERVRQQLRRVAPAAPPAPRP
jgi:DNA-binding transcriptional LysR family regulator